MSALLLKDYYVIFRQMKIFLLLILVFSCIPGTFYSTFAVVYASMLPYTALAYDERSTLGPDGCHDAVFRPGRGAEQVSLRLDRRGRLGGGHLCPSDHPVGHLAQRCGRVPPSPSSCCPCAWPCASWTSPCP